MLYSYAREDVPATCPSVDQRTVLMHHFAWAGDGSGTKEWGRVYCLDCFYHAQRFAGKVMHSLEARDRYGCHPNVACAPSEAGEAEAHVTIRGKGDLRGNPYPGEQAPPESPRSRVATGEWAKNKKGRQVWREFTEQGISDATVKLRAEDLLHGPLGGVEKPPNDEYASDPAGRQPRGRFATGGASGSTRSSPKGRSAGACGPQSSLR